MRSIAMMLIATQALALGCAEIEPEANSNTIEQAALPKATLAIECETGGVNVDPSVCLFLEGQFTYRIRLNVTRSGIPLDNRDYIWSPPPGGVKVFGCGRSNNFCVVDVVPPCKPGVNMLELSASVFLLDNRRATSRTIEEEGIAKFFVQGVSPGCDSSIPDDFRACNAPPPSVPAFDWLYNLGGIEDSCFAKARIFWDTVPGTTRYEATLRVIGYGGRPLIRVYEGPANQFDVRVNPSSHVFLRACNHCGCTATSAPLTVPSTDFCFDDF